MTRTASFLFPAFEFALFPSQPGLVPPLLPPPSRRVPSSRLRCKTRPCHLQRCRDALPQITSPARQPVVTLCLRAHTKWGALGALHQASQPGRSCTARGGAQQCGLQGDNRSWVPTLGPVSGTRGEIASRQCLRTRLRLHRLDCIIIFILVAVCSRSCITVPTGRDRRSRCPHPQTLARCPTRGLRQGRDPLLDPFLGPVRDPDHPPVPSTV